METARVQYAPVIMFLIRLHIVLQGMSKLFLVFEQSVLNWLLVSGMFFVFFFVIIISWF